MPPVKSLGNSRAQYNYKFGLTGLEAADPYVPLLVYSDDVFSTTLWDGTGSSHEIETGIDNTGNTLLWTKSRNYANSHRLYTPAVDTAIGYPSILYSDIANSHAGYSSADLSGFTTNGFTVTDEPNASTGAVNSANLDYVAWNFKAEPGFFTIKTWVGDGEGDRYLDHDLGSVPGFVMVKNLTDSQDWGCYHRSIGTVRNNGFTLNENYESGNANIINPIRSTPTASQIHIRGAANEYNTLNKNYVAYIFADNDQRFGTDKDESIIRCGSWTTDSNGYIPEVDIGWEPQFMLWKAATTTSDWFIADSSRGWLGGSTIGGGSYNSIKANSSDAESHSSGANNYASGPLLTSTGFVGDGANWGTLETYIYIAVRRPNKPKTVGTDVFTINTRNGTGNNASITNIGFNPDLVISKTRTSSVQNNAALWYDRVRGNFNHLISDLTQAEDNTSTTGMKISGTTDKTVDIVQLNNINRSGDTNVDWIFRRAPGFFDIVTYEGTGTGAASPATQDVSHNLQAVPELMIVRYRDDGSGSDPAYPWTVYHSALGSGKYLKLNNQGEQTENGQWNGNPTDTVIKLGTNGYTNYNGWSFVAYLFASLPGVSKIGTYSGQANGVDKNIDCGFSSPARFVMIKRYDGGMTVADQGNWGIWDTARGIGTGNDNYLLLNLDNAEVTGYNDISEYASGFTVNGESGTTSGYWNVTGASYIYLAIA